MRTGTKIYTAILLLLLPATFGVIAYFHGNPDKLTVLKEKVGIEELDRPEKEEVAPSGDVAADYVFPFEYYETGFGIYGGHEIQNVIVTAYIKSVGGSLWLPWEAASGSDGGMVCNQSGTVKQILAEEISVSPVSEEVGVAASVFSDLPEGGYYVCLKQQGEEFPYMAYYVAVYERAAYTPSIPCLVTTDNRAEALRGQNFLVFYHDAPEDIVMHFNNLGENTFNRVFYVKTDIMGQNPHNTNMPEGSYEISDSGCTVTIKAEYLDTLSKNQEHVFSLGRKDGSDFVLDGGENSRVVVVLSKKDTDFPYLEGPAVYSLSSKEDCVVNVHMGSSEQVYDSWYWDVEETGEFIDVAPNTEIETGQFVVPREKLEYFKENFGYVGIQVSFKFNEALYFYPWVRIELTD